MDFFKPKYLFLALILCVSHAIAYDAGVKDRLGIDKHYKSEASPSPAATQSYHLQNTDEDGNRD